MRTIELDNRSYALGFLWQIPSESNVSRRAMLKLARAAAGHDDFASEEFNVVSIRAEQYGLGRFDGPLPPKTISLAAAVRPQIEQDAFLGVFCLGESLWWVCCRQHGMVLAEGDVVCRSREEALKVASEQKHYIEKVGYAEVVQESVEASLDYLLPVLWPEPPLRPLFETSLQERQLRQGVVGFVLLLTFCFVASWIYSEYKARQEVNVTAHRLALKESQKREYLAHPEMYFKKAWLEAPGVIEAGRQCAEAVMGLPVSVNMWLLEESVCFPGGGLKITWSHRKGASYVSLPAGARLITPQQAVGNRALTKLASRPSPANPLSLMAREQAAAVLYELTQNISGHLSLNWEPPELLQLDEETSITAPWQRGEFELSQLPAAVLLGADFFGALSYPGTILVSLTRKNDELSIRGVIYAAVFQKE